MLGIPIMTAAGGFIPSSILFVLIWAFMGLSGFVLAELVLSYDEKDVNLLTISQDSLGTVGKAVTCASFMFLFYAIMTAYILAASVLIVQILPISQNVAASLLVLLLYLVLSQGITLVDGLNRTLMIGLVVCYALLVFFGAPYVQTDALTHMDFRASIVSIPILVVSFGYHNLVPTLANYLSRSKSSLFYAIGFGSLIPLAVYLLWEFVILGMVPLDAMAVWSKAQASGEIVTQVLQTTSQNPYVVTICQNFAFFAIATSFLPVAFSFVDFLKDGLKEKQPLFVMAKVASHNAKDVSRDSSASKATKSFFQNSYTISALVVLPPFIISLINPGIFLQALDFAGGFCAVTLFGILPALMAYKRQHFMPSKFVISKKPLLFALLIGSCAIMTIELMHMLGGL